MSENISEKRLVATKVVVDESPTICQVDDIDPTLLRLSYPPHARLSLNRCNLPAEALASLAYQFAPTPLELDAVSVLHRPLFDRLHASNDPVARNTLFRAHMRAHFQFDDPAALGLSANARVNRSRADYLRLLRGWLFDPDGREAAVLKGWVESRFGLLPSPQTVSPGDPYEARLPYQHARASGLYATGALEAQVDVLYAYCQHELQRRQPANTHLRLFRGFSRHNRPSTLARLGPRHEVLCFDSLGSFAVERERADEFGDQVVACDVPLTKVLAFNGLFPGLLQGESEHLVIGGVMLAERVV